MRVTGRTPPGEETPALGKTGGDPASQSDLALERLKGLIERYDNPSKAYPAWATPQFIGKIEGDYDHLARLWEWHVIGADGDEADGDEPGLDGGEA